MLILQQFQKHSLKVTCLQTTLKRFDVCLVLNFSKKRKIQRSIAHYSKLVIHIHSKVQLGLQQQHRSRGCSSSPIILHISPSPYLHTYHHIMRISAIRSLVVIKVSNNLGWKASLSIIQSNLLLQGWLIEVTLHLDMLDIVFKVTNILSQQLQNMVNLVKQHFKRLKINIEDFCSKIFSYFLWNGC